MAHILVNLELKIKTFSLKTVQDAASQLERQFVEGVISAESLIAMASSVTPTFEGVEK